MLIGVLLTATLHRPWLMTLYPSVMAPLSVGWLLLFAAYRGAGCALI